MDRQERIYVVHAGAERQEDDLKDDRRRSGTERRAGWGHTSVRANKRRRQRRICSNQIYDNQLSMDVTRKIHDYE